MPPLTSKTFTALTVRTAMDRWLYAFDDLLIHGGFAVDVEADTHVACLGAAAVINLHRAAQRLADRREPAVHAQFGDAEVAFGCVAHQHQVHGNLLLHVGEFLFHLVELGPAVGLSVSDEVNLLGFVALVMLQRGDRELQRGGEIGGAVGRPGLADGLAQEAEIERRLGDDRLHVVGGEEKRRR